MIKDIIKAVGDDKKANELLSHKCEKIEKEDLYLPGNNFVDAVHKDSDRSAPVLRSLQTLFDSGKLGGTGYLSILPVDQGVEYAAGNAFAKNPIYFDPENIVKLAVEAQCSAVVSTLGVMGAVSRKYAHKIPFIVKLNHNELLSHPNTYDQRVYASVDQARDMGAIGVAATIYYGSENSNRQIEEVSQLFEYAHSKGMFTVLWTYLRNPEFVKGDKDYHLATDLTGQANYLGATIQADLIKQKLPTINRGFADLGYGPHSEDMYELTTDNPIDMVRYQLLNCYSGRVGLLNSGGGSGSDDLRQAVTSAIINKRAGGMGIISGRKAFQKPFKDGVELLERIQDVYLCEDVTIA